MRRNALVLLLLAAACGKFDNDSRIATTATTTGAGARRLWAVTHDGDLVSVVLESDGTSQWASEGASSTAKAGGVSAFSWVSAGVLHERAYFVNTNNVLVARLRDGGVASWINTAPPAGITLRGPTAARSIVVDGARLVLAVGDGPNGPVLVSFIGQGNPEVSYTVTVNAPPVTLASDTPVALAAAQISVCAIVRTSAGSLAAFDLTSWQVSAPPSGTLAGALAIYGVAGFDVGGDYTAFARTSAGAVMQIGLGGCLMPVPTWTSLGNPTGGVAAGMFALDVAKDTDTTLAAASTNGSLYVKQASGGGAFGAWASRPAAGDTLGAVGPVHVAEAAGRVCYVGNASTGGASDRAGYAFDSPISGAARNYLDPNAKSAQPNNETNDGHWTEAFTAERLGKVVSVGVAVDSTSADLLKKHWVHYALSEDDGHSFASAIAVERCYPAPGLPAPSCADVSTVSLPAGSTSFSGDPWGEADTNGNRFVSYHEIALATCGASSPNIFSSRVSVYRVSGASMVREAGSTTVIDDITGSTVENYYIDHPALATTSDGRTHLFWYKHYYNGMNPAIKTQMYYKSRTAAGTWSASSLLFTEETQGRASAGPVPVVAGDSNVLAFFADSGAAGGGSQLRACRLSGSACASIVDLASAGANCMATGGSFLNGGSTTFIRATGYAVAGAPGDALHFYAAYRRPEVAANACPANDAGVRAVVLTQSLDGGLSWSAPVQVSTPGTDNLDLGLSVARDGSVFVSYLQRADTTSNLVNPRMAVCTACSATPAPADFVEAAGPGAATLNLANYPNKCGGDGNSVFLGDYHGTSGGLSRVHMLRSDARSSDPAPTGRLIFSTVSRWVRR